MRVILIQLNQLIGKEIKTNLENNGYEVIWVENFEKAYTTLTNTECVAMVADFSFISVDDLHFLSKIREENEILPILKLTDNCTKNRVQSFELNQFEKENVVYKKFDTNEINDKLRNIVYRATLAQKESVIIDIGKKTLILSPNLRRVQYNGKTVSLSKKEFMILSSLIRNTGNILSSEDLQKLLYELDKNIDSNTIQVYVCNLRRKLDRKLIRTIHGAGYVIEAQT